MSTPKSRVKLEPPPFVSNGKIHYNRTVEERDNEIQAIELTKLELDYAIWSAKQKKWYQERRGENDSMKATNEDEKINIVKGLT